MQDTREVFLIGKIGSIAPKKHHFRKIPLKDARHVKYHQKTVPPPLSNIPSWWHTNIVKSTSKRLKEKNGSWSSPRLLSVRDDAEVS